MMTACGSAFAMAATASSTLVEPRTWLATATAVRLLSFKACCTPARPSLPKESSTYSSAMRLIPMLTSCGTILKVSEW
jgi:hypothetical protein